MPHARMSTACLATVTAAVALVALTGCGGGSHDKKTGVTRILPSLTGSTLTAARSAASGAGFANLTVADATGAKRSTAAAADWRVCFQQPGAGRADTGTHVRLSVARLTESCPAKDSSAATSSATSTRKPTHRATHRSTTTHHSSTSRKSRSHH